MLDPSKLKVLKSECEKVLEVQRARGADDGYLEVEAGFILALISELPLPPRERNAHD